MSANTFRAFSASLVVICLLAAPKFAKAEDINEIFKRVNDFVAAENYSKAMEELSWARKEIEKLHLKKLTTLFPNELNGFAGAEVETGGALGFTSIERKYTKGSQRFDLSLTGGSGNGGGGLGGLAGLGRMAAMFGANSPQSGSFRIEGRTAMLENKASGNGASVTVFLNSGSILKLDSPSVDGETLRKAAEALKVSEIDSYLQGSSS